MKLKVLILLLLSSFCGFAQQTLKRITETDTEFILELFLFRNGTNDCEISGPETFGWASGTCSYKYSSSTVPYYDHSPSAIYENQFATPNMQLGTQNFIFNSNLNQHRKSYDEGYATFQGENNTSYAPMLNITTECYAGGAKLSNTIYSVMYYGKLILKKTLNDGSPIETNLWVSFKTYDAYYSSNPFIRVGDTWYGKYDGSNWVEQTTDMSGNPVPYIASICSLLSTNEIESIDNENFIYPNPITSAFTIQKTGNTYDAVQYEIMDYSGRLLKTGSATTNTSIDISDIQPGNYILRVKSQDKEFHQKIIKN